MHFDEKKALKTFPGKNTQKKTFSFLKTLAVRTDSG